MIIDTMQVQEDINDFCQNFTDKLGVELDKDRLFNDRISALISGDNPCSFRRKENNRYIDYDIVTMDKQNKGALAIVFTEDAKITGDEITVPLKLSELAKTGDIADAVFKKISVGTAKKKKLAGCER